MQYTFESDWFLYNVGLHLTPVDLYNLKHVTKGTYREIKRKDIDDNIIRGIHRRLRELLGDKYELFINHIRVNNIVISGLFLTECILGKQLYNHTTLNLFFHENENDDNYIDIFGIKRDKRHPSDNYGNFRDTIRIYNTTIETTYIPYKNANSFVMFEEFVIDIFAPNICKNLFQVTNNGDILYVRDFINFVNKNDVIYQNHIDINNAWIIKKCIMGGFDIKIELIMDEYFKYSVDKKPFLVYKLDKDDTLDKLTFLDKVMSKEDVIDCIKEKGGDIIISITPDKCNNISEKWLFGIYFWGMFMMLLEGGGAIRNKRCYCHATQLCGIAHKHWKVKTCRMNTNNKIIREFLLVNYDDLTINMKRKYDKIFNVLDDDNYHYDSYIDIDTNINIENLHYQFREKYFELLDNKRNCDDDSYTEDLDIDICYDAMGKTEKYYTENSGYKTYRSVGPEYEYNSQDNDHSSDIDEDSDDDGYDVYDNL